jgi:hypothetical protein
MGKRESHRYGFNTVESKFTYLAMIALNLARLTTILGFTFLQTATISLPMCSPSRSQSVQIISKVAIRASAFRFVSMDLEFGGM